MTDSTGQGRSKRDLAIAYAVDCREHPPTDEAAFRALFRRWVGKVNVENLLVIAGTKGWSTNLGPEDAKDA